MKSEKKLTPKKREKMYINVVDEQYYLDPSSSSVATAAAVTLKYAGDRSLNK